MIVNAYSVFDNKLAVYGRPWYELRDAAAIRIFTDAVNDGSNPNNQWFKHPEDFSLFRIGRFDDEKGEFLQMDEDGNLIHPSQLVSAASVFDFKKVVSSAQLDMFDKNGRVVEEAK